MGMHNKRSEAKDSEEDEEMAEDVNVEQEVPIEKASENSVSASFCNFIFIKIMQFCLD